MPVATELENRYESVGSIVESLNDEQDIGDIIIVPGRFAIDVCISSSEELKDEDQCNEFMLRYTPTKRELNGNYKRLSISEFEVSDGMLRLGKFVLKKVDFSDMEDDNGLINKRKYKEHFAPARLEGDAARMHNVFGRPREHSELTEGHPNRLLVVRFFVDWEHLEEAVYEGKNTTAIPLSRLSSIEELIPADLQKFAADLRRV